jgi:hypothetical protein
MWVTTHAAQTSPLLKKDLGTGALERSQGPRAPKLLNKAVQIIFEDYEKDAKMAAALGNMDVVGEAQYWPDYEKRIRAILEKNPSPKAKGFACLRLAQHLTRQAELRELRGGAKDKFIGEAKQLLEREIAKYGAVEYGNFEGEGLRTLGQQAQMVLKELAGEN